MDEVGIEGASDAIYIMEAAEKATPASFWLVVSSIENGSEQHLYQMLQTNEVLRNDTTFTGPTTPEVNFHVVKDELNLPLRNTASIIKHAFNIGTYLN